MKFLGQGFQKFEHEQDRHTDATECITTANFAVVKIDFVAIQNCEMSHILRTIILQQNNQGIAFRDTLYNIRQDI